MKKLQLAMIAAALLGAASISYAQAPQQQSAPPPEGRMRTTLFNGITLTAEQQAKVDSLGRAHRELRELLMRDSTLDQDARRAKAHELMTKGLDEIRGSLTDEQKTVFDKNLDEMRAHMKQGGHQHPPQH